ncbi:MAG: type IV pilus assembly protein PilC [Parcubacteria group bacterium Gr01-1014_38]|nr:MAG: type IV pilus assembly protein PilC [Parcubacteria group bacterium Gr01-1014_38]
MEFSYTATTDSGETRTGTVEAGSAREVVSALKTQGLIVLSIRPERERTPWQKRFGGWFVRASATERVLLARHLALILRAGLPIDRAFEILQSQGRNKGLRRVLHEILIRIQKGDSLAAALARYPTVFPPIFVAIVQWGEIGGTLVESLEHLAGQLEKDHDLRVKVRGALFYPAIVIGATIVLGVIMAVFILPRLVILFESFRVDLPLSTRIFLAVARFFLRRGVLLIPLLIALLVGAFVAFRSKALRPFTSRLILRMPVFGSLMKQVNLARFDRILGSLLRSGIPVVDALGITAESVGNYQYRRALQAVQSAVREGVPIGREIEKYAIFPTIQTQMVTVGEATGRLADVLLFLAEFTERDVDARTKTLATAVEPLLLIVIGVVVGGVAIAIITPIYQLTASFSK